MGHSHHEMTDQEWLELNRRAAAGVPQWEIPLMALMALGLLGFILGFVGEANRGLQAFWVNFLFWGGLAQAGVVFAAIIHITRGQWGPTMARIGLLQVWFPVVNLVLYVVIAISAWRVVPWIAHSEEHQLSGFKAWWLQPLFMVARDFLGLAILAAVGVKFARTVMRPEIGVLAQLRQTPPPPGWRGVEAERQAARTQGTSWAIGLVICYALVYSLIAFDMVMSFEPMWYSTMFGGYYFVTAIYMALAAMIVWATILRRRMGLEDQLGAKQFHDTGKLMFGFCILSAYTGFSQILPIWYGDMPEEIAYIINRTRHPVWHVLVLVVIFGGFLLPFLIMINRRVKTIPATLAAVALLVLLVGFTERNLLVMPPLFPPTGEPLGLSVVEIIAGILVTAGFAGLYAFTFLQSLRRGVVVPRAWRIEPFAY